MSDKCLSIVLAIFALASLALLCVACSEKASDIQPAPTATVERQAEATSDITPTPATLSATATPTPSAVASLFPFTITDSNGEEVSFEEPPEKIVAFDSAAVEILFAIGEGGRVVGTHDFVSYPPETTDIPRLGDNFNMNIEATVALEPDLVFVFFDTALPDLEIAGLKVLYLESLTDDFRKVADNIRLWGGITGSPDVAEAVAAQFEARIAKIEETLAPHGAGPSVFQDEGELWTPGSDTLVGQVFSLLKLQNIAHDVSGYAQMSPEVIVERDPEIIIASYGDTISGNPAFKNIAAVENNRILVPQSDALNVAGPRFAEGIETLAKWVYPELFK